MKFLAMLMLALMAAPVLADTEMVFNDGSRVLVKDGKVLFGDEETGILFPGSGTTMTVVEWKDRTYMVIDEDFADSVSGQIDAAMAEMEKQLAQLPPEQQAMMREMMKSRMPMQDSSRQPQRDYRASGKKGKVAGFDCAHGQLLVDGQPEFELCTATPRELGMPGDDFDALTAAFRAMAGLMKKFMRGNDVVMDLELMNGVPVMSREINGDNDSQLVSVSTESIDGARLTVPSDFSERDIRTM